MTTDGQSTYMRHFRRGSNESDDHTDFTEGRKVLTWSLSDGVQYKDKRPVSSTMRAVMRRSHKQEGKH